jgi:multiple sugar transport system substrate-binding protein
MTNRYQGIQQGKTVKRVLAGIAFTLGISTLPSLAQAWTYKDAAAPYKGQQIVILDEVTPLQLTFGKLVPDFIKETGILVNYQLLNHFEVISKGQADLLSGRGAYDAVLLHSAQMGLLLDANVLRPINDMLGDAKLNNPDFDPGDFIEPAWSSTAKHKGNTYGFLTWNYNVVYWARNDLLTHPGEKTAFKAKYGYELQPAKTMKQMRDISEFFTRKAGDKLAGRILTANFYGIAMEGIKGGTTWGTVWNSFLKNWGGDIFDKNGRPDFDTPENRAAMKFWGDLWKFGPPGMAEASLLDVPTLMGKGIAAQVIAWSDFALGVDRPGKSPFAGQFAYGAMPVKTGSKGPRSSESAPSIIAMSKATKHPQATYLFLQWMVDKTTQAKLARALGGGVPVRNSSWDLPAFKKSPLAPLYAAMRETLKTTRAKPRSPYIFKIFDVMSGLAQDVGLGKITAGQATKRGQAELLKICQKCTL